MRRKDTEKTLRLNNDKLFFSCGIDCYKHFFTITNVAVSFFKAAVTLSII